MYAPETIEEMRRRREYAEKANENLRRCKCCNACANANVGFSDDDIPQYQVICKITGENRKGRSGSMCPNWK